MSGQLLGTRSYGVGEIMSSLQFQEELQHVARFARPRPPVENPLAVAVQTIKDAPHFTQSRLLGRILAALTYDRGEFRRAEASALDSATLGIVIELINAARAGTTAREDWINAVTACDAAAAG